MVLVSSISSFFINKVGFTYLQVVPAFGGAGQVTSVTQKNYCAWYFFVAIQLWSFTLGDTKSNEILRDRRIFQSTYIYQIRTKFAALKKNYPKKISHFWKKKSRIHFQHFFSVETKD